MVLLATLLAVPACGIVIVHLVVYTGLSVARIRERRLRGNSARGLSACVVVPARNEERLLPRLLSSLEDQSDDRFRVVLVDDRSSDATGRLMDEFAAKFPERVKVIHLTEVKDIGNPKLFALMRGVEAADGDCILFTDADCVVPRCWVEGMTDTFDDERVGLVLGPIETVKTRSLLSLFHSFDHVFKYAYNAGCAGIDQATGGFGNNLAVRRAALEEIGGMSSIAVSVTEDAALIAALRERTGRRIAARFDRSVTVHTQPQPDLRALTEQEIRWHTGGLFSPDLISRLSYRFIMFYLTASVLAIPPAVFVPVFAILPVVSFLTMAGTACFSGWYTRQPLRVYWVFLIPFVLAAMCYNSFLTVRAMCRPVLLWKGEKLSGYGG